MLISNIQIPKEIFIISLKKDFEISKKRTYFLVNTILKKLNFEKPNINFVGINGENLVHKKINNKYISLKKYRFDLNIGTMACALSHALVLKFIQIKQLYTDVLIFEEDAILNENFCNIFEYVPNDYDIIYLHSYYPRNFYSQFDIKKENKILSSKRFKKENKILSSKRFKKINKPPNYRLPSGLNAFLVNGRNINKIINNLLPFKEAADWHYLNQYDKLNQYFTNPSLKLCTNPPCVSLRYRIDLKYRNENKI